MRSLYCRCIVAVFILAVVLTGCGDTKSSISVSSDAVSINDIILGVASISNNDIPNDDTVSAGSIVIEKDEYVDIKDAKAGDIVIFGEYEQDGDTSTKEPIEWVVLDEYEDTILIFSRYIIDKKSFNETDTSVYWSQSTLRTWLNEGFISEAFNEKEQEKLVVSTLNNPGSSQYFAEFNKSGGTATGNNTADRVFLLSFDDVLKYYEPVKVDKYYVYASSDLICQATAASGIENKSMDELEYNTFYASEGWPEDCLNNSGAGWFLRSHGINGDDVMSVGYDGGMRGYYFQIGGEFETVTFEGGVRPAIWIYRE